MFYNRLIELTIESRIFETGQTFNRVQFKRALEDNNLLHKFNMFYLNDTNCNGKWLMWDFSDRFQRFANALCKIGYCRKIKNGVYLKI